MNYRFYEIVPSQSLSTTARTESYPINIKDPISALLFEYKNTRGSVTSIEHVAACLPNISLVDGSTPLFSLTGKEAHAMAFFDKGLPPYSVICNVSTIMQILGFTYNFGRKLWDTQYAFDPKQFKNPILQVQHSYQLADASASAHYLRVVACCFDEKSVSPSGFLMSKEIATPPWVANTSKYDLLLPTDYPIRKLMLRGYLDDYYPYQVINHFKIDEDSGKRIPFDIDTSAWLKIIHSLYPRYQEELQAECTTTTRDIFATPHFDINVAGAQISGSTPMIIEKMALNEPFGIIGAATTQGSYQVSGHDPHACFPILFGDQDDPADWYDVTKVGKLNLELTGGSAGSSSVVNIVAQQLRHY
jgi:hypothetical protein